MLLSVLYRNPSKSYLHLVLTESKTFRYVLFLTLAYLVLRLLFHVGTVVALLYGMVGEDVPLIPVDLQVYIDASEHITQKQGLYLTGENLTNIEYHFPYPPSYALAFVPFLWLYRVSPGVLVFVHTLLHLAAYALIYLRWDQIFYRLDLDYGRKLMVWTLPLWLIFSAFWADLGYLNIYILMALLATLLIDAVLQENLGWSLLWLSLILQTKPHWAFALFVPLFLGQYRFFVKLIGLALVTYLMVAAITVLVMDPTYGLHQYADYYRLLIELRDSFPWRTVTTKPFLGYNHSLKQIVFYWLGITPITLRLAVGLKLLVLTPLAMVGLRYIIYSFNHTRFENAPLTRLDMAFVLYLAAFIWLDIVWEATLSIAVFTYLLATFDSSYTKLVAWIAFLPYALVDLWQVVSFLTFGWDIMVPGPYLLTDFSIYLPIIMVTILTFYILLVKRLWERANLLHLSA